MPYAGVSWNATGHSLVVLDDAGTTLVQAHFPPGQTEELLGLTASFTPDATVIESTNGILDGRMMARGLSVYRADPPVLSRRPLFGSVPATELAELARTKLDRLTRLVPDRGTQTGREDELEAGYTASSATLRELVGAGRLIEHGGSDRPLIALTFDDGPLPPYTEEVLDVLEHHRVLATFFCVGAAVAGHPDLVRRMVGSGHTVGNHTWSHPFLPELSQPELVEQLTRTAEAIDAATGAGPPALFRPPYGSRTSEVLGWLADLVPATVLWDVYPFDWTMPGASVIAEQVVTQATAGSIVLLHDGGGDRSQTVAALPDMIEGLRDKGYEFVTADVLVGSVAAPADGARA